jgi:hypothetical protein
LSSGEATVEVLYSCCSPLSWMCTEDKRIIVNAAAVDKHRRLKQLPTIERSGEDEILVVDAVDMSPLQKLLVGEKRRVLLYVDATDATSSSSDDEEGDDDLISRREGTGDDGSRGDVGVGFTMVRVMKR